MTKQADNIIRQHDFVDNTIYDSICAIVGDEVPWDIEVIGDIRDRILVWLVVSGIEEPDNIYPILPREE